MAGRQGIVNEIHRALASADCVQLAQKALQASRAPDGRYRTSPLSGLFTHTKGGFYHDGRFATLGDVIAHYDSTFALGLTAAQKSDLAQYLLSL